MRTWRFVSRTGAVLQTRISLTEAQEAHRRGDLPRAADAYLALLKEDPANADALYGLGTVRYQQDQVQEARELLNRACQAAPDVPEFAFNLGLVLEALGEMDAAAGALRRAARGAAGAPEMLEPVCAKLLDLGRPEAAADLLRRFPARRLSLRLLALRSRAESGDPGGARRRLAELAGEHAHDPEAQRACASLALRLHDPALAGRCHRAWLDGIDATDAQRLEHAEFLYRIRDTGAAAALLASLAGSPAWDAEADLLAARCARLAGDYPRARHHLERVLAEEPERAEAWQMALELRVRSAAETARVCADLARAGAGNHRERVVLALTAGAAFDALDDPGQAFRCYRLGKDQVSRHLKRRGRQYHPVRSRARAEAILDHFTRLPADPDAARTAPPREQSPVFIVGMPRSGTTLVERILTGLAGVVPGGENEAMDWVAGEYWHGVATEGESGEAGLATLRARYWRCTGGEPRRLTDKLPHNFRHLGLIARLFPASPILYLQRDPRDVCLSIYSRPFPDSHAYACELSHIAHFCGVCAHMMSRWQALLPGRVLPVRYEDLVREPDRLGREMARFCGLDWDPACLDIQQRTDASHTFSELQVREPINPRGIGRWSRYASELAPAIRELDALGLLDGPPAPANGEGG